MVTSSPRLTEISLMQYLVNNTTNYSIKNEHEQQSVILCILCIEAALISNFTLTMDEITMCNMKDVASSAVSPQLHEAF